MSSQTTSDSPEDGWGMTLAFWATLLVAGCFFAVVTLAPKFKTLAELKAQYVENQLRLIELERQANELERIAAALEHDPAFKAELAKAEFALVRTDGERIAVSEELRLGAVGESMPLTASPMLAGDWSIPPPVIDLFATNVILRGTMLAIAGILAVTALLFLNDEQAIQVKAAVGNASELTRRLTDRYRKS